MRRNNYHPTERLTDRIHPLLYIVLVGLALWFVVSAWAFAGDEYTDYLLVVVTGLVFIAVLIPAVIWSIWRSHPHEGGWTGEPFKFWAASELRIWQDRVKARDAMIEILLPVAAVAFGLLIFAIINHLTPR